LRRGSSSTFLSFSGMLHHNWPLNATGAWHAILTTKHGHGGQTWKAGSSDPPVRCQAAIGRVYFLQLVQHCRPRLFAERQATPHRWCWFSDLVSHPALPQRFPTCDLAASSARVSQHPCRKPGSGNSCVALTTAIQPAVPLPDSIGSVKPEASRRRRENDIHADHLTWLAGETIDCRKILMRNAPYFRAFCFVGVSQFRPSPAVPPMLQFLYRRGGPSEGHQDATSCCAYSAHFRPPVLRKGRMRTAWVGRCMDLIGTYSRNRRSLTRETRLPAANSPSWYLRRKSDASEKEEWASGASSCKYIHLKALGRDLAIQPGTFF